MIIYGWNNRIIKEAPVDKVTCPNCKNDKMHIRVFGFYVHIFWIPLFPYKKDVILSCDHCQMGVSGGELDDTMKKLKKSVSFPKYMFLGSALLLAFVAYLVVDSHLQDKKELSFLTHPEVGDVYHLIDKEEVTEYKYYLLKAQEVMGDSMAVSANGFAYNMVPKELMAGDGFYKTQYMIDKKSLMELYESGELVKVQREYNNGSGFDRELDEEEAILEAAAEK